MGDNQRLQELYNLSAVKRDHLFLIYLQKVQAEQYQSVHMFFVVEPVILN